MSNWVNIKPEFKMECILLTATLIRGRWDYNAWLIERVDSEEGWYWGWLCLDGEEYGDINDLQADMYKTIVPPSILKLIKNKTLKQQ